MIDNQMLLTLLGAYLSVSVFSFLYKDNIFFSLSEHIFVGLSGGITLYQGIKSIYTTSYLPTAGGNLQFIIPIILGICSLTLFTTTYKWIYRYTISFVIALGLGLTVRAVIFSGVIGQLKATILNIRAGTPIELLGNIYILIGTLCAIFYFISTIQQKGTTGIIAKIGRLVIMVAFGASFAGEMNWGFSQASGPFFTIAQPPGIYITLVAGAIIILDLMRPYLFKKGNVS